MVDFQMFASLISALAALQQLVPAAVEFLKPLSPGAKELKKVTQWMEDHYWELRLAVSPKSARVLRAVGADPGHQTRDYRAKMYPGLDLESEAATCFDDEFQYRMDYLVLLGVLARDIHRYHLTPLGEAFLHTAADKGDKGWTAECDHVD